MFSKLKLIIILSIITMLFILSGCVQTPVECNSDSDCVPETCCHPNECVAKQNAPDCSGIFCSAVCEPGTLDCQQGNCLCKNGFCTAEIY